MTRPGAHLAEPKPAKSSRMGGGTRKRSVGSPALVAVDKINDLVGRNLQRLRMKEGFTSEALAEQTGLSHSLVKQHESLGARVSAGQLKIYADALRVPLESFYRPVLSPTPSK